MLVLVLWQATKPCSEACTVAGRRLLEQTMQVRRLHHRRMSRSKARMASRHQKIALETMYGARIRIPGAAVVGHLLPVAGLAMAAAAVREAVGWTL